MSGIAGIYNLDGRPVDPALLKRMTDVIAHRGPDGIHHWIDGPVGLGHCMLGTTPESLHETQPLTDETGNLCLTFDGRVDNREELKAALEAKGALLRTDTDAELILRAYERWEEGSPQKILGDFAFVIWDSRKRKLFCARDPLGVKPFYYCRHGSTFLFSSEMPAFFAELTFQRKPNISLIGQYLVNVFNEREETLYEGIYCLPMAHTLVLENNNLRQTCYWDIDPARTIRYQVDAEYAEHFRALFREAVQCRLRSSGPVGALLSGGLDSSSIVCTAQELYQQQAVPNHGFETFSVVFDQLPCDERQYALEVVNKYGIKAEFFTYERDLDWMNFKERTKLYPDVFYEPIRPVYMPVLKRMQNRGIKVVFDGYGGDELLTGSFVHLTDLLRSGHFRKLIKRFTYDATIYDGSTLSLFVKYCFKPLIPRRLRLAIRAFLRLLRKANDDLSWMNPEFLRSNRAKHLKSSRIPARFNSRYEQEIYDGLFYGWNSTVALPVTETFRARFGVETRFPFLDRRLVEFMFAIPEEQRWWNDQPKLVLRRAMQGILPESIQWRKGKTEYSCFIDQELRIRLPEEVRDLFQSSILSSLGIIDKERLLELFEKYRQGTFQYLTLAIELALALEVWCRCSMGVPLGSGPEAI